MGDLKGLHLADHPFSKSSIAVAYFYTKSTVWAIRAPWHFPLFKERSGIVKTWKLPFKWRLTARKKHCQ